MIFDKAEILVQTPTCIFWKNTRSEFLGCNQQYARFAGLSNTDAVRGLTDLDLPWPQYAKAYIEGDQEILDGLPSYNRIETIIKPSTGEALPIFTSKTALYDQQGHKAGVIGSFSIISFDEIQNYQIEQKINLTKREKDIVRLMLTGKTCKKIAFLLNLSARTVENYLANLKTKLNVSSKAELIEKILACDSV